MTEKNVSQLVYVSRATPGVGPDELQTILATAQPYNAAHGITGFLTFDGTSFFQLLEGGGDSLEGLMARIEADPRHDAVRRIWSDTGERLLPRWSMHHEHYERATEFVRDQVRLLIEARGERGPTRRQIQQLVLRLRLESLARR